MLEKELTIPAVDAAKRLLGCILEREIDGKTVRVMIVETEAYDETDAASHSFNGRTPRTDVMFGPAGHLYIYFTYGMHYCCNVVTGQKGEGSAVLLRAAEPLIGEDILEKRRSKTGVDVTNGPAKLCQSLGIDKKMNGHDLEPDKIPQLTRIKPPKHQVRHGNVNETFAVSRVSLVVFAQSPEAVKPPESTLTHPALRYNLKGMEIIISLHNLQFNASQFLDPGNKLAAVPAIGPDLFQ